MFSSCFAASLLALAATDPGSGRADESAAFPELGLTIALPKLDSIERGTPESKNCKGEWRGKLKDSEIRLRLQVLPTSEYDFVEPEDVVETWRDALRDPKLQAEADKGFDYSFGSLRALSGPVGSSPILVTVQASAKQKDDPALEGTLLLCGGLLIDSGWSLRIDAWPALDAADTQALATYLETCAKYDGKLRDPKWTDEEALAYWKRYAPESTFKKFEKPVRTEHFIVLTNSTSPGPFVKKLEARYAAIRKVLPFEELKGRRLLPVLLFRTDDDFQAFYRKQYKMEPKDDVTEMSVAIGEFIATSCDDDDDYEHGVDLAKQVLINRQRGWGGCDWFQSGLREYVSTKAGDRVEGVRAIKKGKYTPLEKLLKDESWSKQRRKMDQKGASDEADYWSQAALWIEFLHDGPWPKESFARFVQTVGGLDDGDSSGVQAAMESIYGMDLKSLEGKWVEYFKKR